MPDYVSGWCEHVFEYHSQPFLLTYPKTNLDKKRFYIKKLLINHKFASGSSKSKQQQQEQHHQQQLQQLHPHVTPSIKEIFILSAPLFCLFSVFNFCNNYVIFLAFFCQLNQFQNKA